MGSRPSGTGGLTLRILAADLHLHTALSPCAAEEMSPPEIVRAACEADLAMIAICDHNSAGNAAAVRRAAGDRLGVLAGIEITTAEEVHLVGLFPDSESAEAAAAVVHASLPDATLRDVQWFGDQLLLNERGERVGTEPRLLAAACRLDLTRAVELVHRHGGLAVAAHIDRPAFGIFGQLGLFPHDAGFDAVEISPAGLDPPWAEAMRALTLPLLRSSDAHFLADIGRTRTVLAVEAPSFDELRLALLGRDGRRVL